MNTIKQILLSVFITMAVFANSYAAGLFDTPVAMISDMRGKVRFENTTDREADFGTDIFIGDMIKTGNHAFVSLTFYNGCRQEKLAPNSLIQVGQNKSILKQGKFETIKQLDCQIPEAVLSETDSHLKAGLVLRALDNPDALQDIPVLIKNNELKISLWTNKGKQGGQYQIGEPMVFHLISADNAYVQLAYISSNGMVEDLSAALLIQLAYMKAAKLYTLGLDGDFIAGPPVGTDYIHILLSDQPIEINTNWRNAKGYFKALKSAIRQHPDAKYAQHYLPLFITQ